MNFIEKNTKKVALVLCLATAGTAVTTVYAAQNSDGWHGSGTDRVYKMEGQVKTSSWVFDEAGSYYLTMRVIRLQVPGKKSTVLPTTLMQKVTV